MSSNKVSRLIFFFIALFDIKIIRYLYAVSAQMMNSFYSFSCRCKIKHESTLRQQQYPLLYATSSFMYLNNRTQHLIHSLGLLHTITEKGFCQMLAVPLHQPA
ncbi:hypothetical protein VT98_10652 [Candidatus Electrothrix communis]|uniref:Uncharacterized protein n=1 Tax=Candidatus Electrothrix communis TaxID=1859133 RepID=A0A3S3UFW1_9BACT|nr:hypothetical protein VT98_10652 [Candidatus Electrothrix communis]